MEVGLGCVVGSDWFVDVGYVVDVFVDVFGWFF